MFSFVIPAYNEEDNIGELVDSLVTLRKKNKWDCEIVVVNDNISDSTPNIINDFAKKIFELQGKIGLVFGREDYGLYNEEIAECDALIRIPTSESYLALNLSHAVSLVLYSLYIKNEYIPKEKRNIGKIEKEKLFGFFSNLLEEIHYPEHRKENTKIMFKRIMGRAMPSKWEYHTLMGVFSRTLEKIRDKKKKAH